MKIAILVIFPLLEVVSSSLTHAEEVERTCSTIPAFVSILFITFVILSIILFSKLHTICFYILLFQNIFELLFNLNHFIFFVPPRDNTWKCSFQGWYSVFTTTTSILFTWLITYYMYSIIIKKNYILTTFDLLKVASSIIILSGILAAIPFTTHQIGDTGLSCGILEDGSDNTSRATGIAMRYSLYYCIVWGVCLYSIWAYLTIYGYIKRLQNDLQGNVTSTTRGPSEIEVTIYRLRYYPAILIITWIGVTILRIWRTSSGDPPLWSSCCSRALIQSQGTFNALVFISYRRVWSSWMNYFGLQIYFKSESSSSGRKDKKSFGRTSELGSEDSFPDRERNKSPTNHNTHNTHSWNLFGYASDDKKTLLTEPIYDQSDSSYPAPAPAPASAPPTANNITTTPSNFSISHSFSSN